MTQLTCSSLELERLSGETDNKNFGILHVLMRGSCKMLNPVLYISTSILKEGDFDVLPLLHSSSHGVVKAQRGRRQWIAARERQQSD